MKLPVVWMSEAAAELRQARAWYDDILPDLGERFAGAVEATVETIAQRPFSFRLFIGDGDERDCGGSRTEYPLRCMRTGLS